MDNMASYLKDYSNIEKLVNLMEDQKQINILLGLEENKIVQHITAIHKDDNTIVLSGVFKTRYFSYEITIKDNDKIINSNQSCELMYISFDTINRIIGGKEYTSIINNMNIYEIYQDKEYLDSLHEGLEYIIDLDQSNITFQKDEVKVKVFVNHFYCINEDKSVYGISFICNNNENQSVTIYFDKENKSICYGYLSKFIENRNKKGFYISRKIEEVIKELKNIAIL